LASAPIDIARVQAYLASGSGGYEIVHRSPGLELGVYVLVAPEPDRQQPHEDDEVYVVLEGGGVLEVWRASRSSCARARRSSSRPEPSTASSAMSA
jgi:hypothetical protein